MNLAYLTACYILGSRYHSGQASKGYLLLCQADRRSLREYGVDLGRQVEHLDNHARIIGKEWRREVAAMLNRWRHLRNTL